MSKSKDIVDILRDAGFGVVEGAEAVKQKIQEIGGTSARRMPLERNRKAVDAFCEVKSYHPSQEVKYR